MNKSSFKTRTQGLTRWWGRAALLAGLLLQSQANADFILNVVDGTGAPVTNYRWLIEEDNTTLTTPGIPRNDTISLVIHKSHAPVVTNGISAASSTVVTTDPNKRYAVSVLADGYQLGGANVTNNQAEVRVILNKHPLPTAQISVLAFHDSNPINNVPDATEAGLPGFKVVLFDFLGGPMLQDVFGNPLGTTYEFDTAGNPQLDGEGAPIVKVMGDGNIYTDANGKALVKYIAMGKYGVQVIPPTGSQWTGGHGSANAKGAWHQTATIEGTQTVDAWVKANEPMIFIEGFGPGTYHVFFGYVDPAQTPWVTNPPPVGVTLMGTNRYNHFGRPPVNQQFAVGPPVSEAWVALNEVNALGAAGQGLYAAPCDPNTGVFIISNVPPGTYQLVTWDKPLSALFGINTITVPNTPVHNLGNVLSFRWFGTLEGSIFYDTDQDGFRDANEFGIPNMAVNIRWRDGTVYQATVTDAAGDYALSQVFPFFKWLVGEVDFGRYKATGMTAVIDEGGLIPPDDGWDMPSEGVRTPQPQFETNPDGTAILTSEVYNTNTLNNLARTEVGPVLTEAMHLFLNQNNRIDWGKVDYAPGENGGISGIVGYQTTRAELDPRNGTIDPWEPGVPRVQMVLYRDANADKVIDDLDGDGAATPSDVDNFPFNWTQPVPPAVATKGPEDVDHNNNGTFDPGDAIQIVWSDSWDAGIEEFPTLGAIQTNPPVVLGKAIIGSDNYSTWNQIRPAVFDGGYLFDSCYANGIVNATATEEPVSPLPVGYYIVQSCPPPSYLIQTEESLNVVFGDAYIPSKLWVAPECVGTATNHVGDLAYLQRIVPSQRSDVFTVAPILTMFPDQAVSDPGVNPYANQVRPLADMKWVMVSDRKNAACDFHIYTEVPKSTRVVGFVLNDLTAEFNAFSPIFGEKGSPGWLPISIRDWAGHEVARTYSDEYGSYNALVPSTYNVAVPAPSGVAPNMLTLVLNDPTMPDPANPSNRIPDPNYNPAFATTPWTLHYYPGTFLYADTPIVPIAGFVGAPNNQLDVEPPNNTPMILSVTGTLAGPYVANLSDTITIQSLGTVNVPDPNCLGYGCNNTVPRNFGFGPFLAGTSRVTLRVNGTDHQLALVDPPGAATAWNATRVLCRLQGAVPPLPPGPLEGQLMVTRNNGRTTPIGVTLTYDPDTSKVTYVTPIDYSVTPLATPIQDAIDAANPGDLIIVPPSGWHYNENPILWKPVRLQGSGLSTVINANTTPAERLSAWHAKVMTLLGGDPFVADECPGIMVLGQTNQAGALVDSGFASIPSRIDGFQIKGAISGGGVALFDMATNLRISNNRIQGNQGSFSGGINLGQQGQMGTTFRNANVTIEYNQILQNGGVTGAGGIGLYTGATGYTIRNNYIVGNFTRGVGGGIGHEGLSPGGLIANNVIAYNEVFYGVPAAAVAASGDGGGIYLGGELAAADGLSSGAGSVTIINNLIQGNLAGSGHGGGIRAAAMNGNDVGASGNANNWYALDILNNVIVNNAAGFYAGGISLQDATRVRILNNTIANNDSTASAQAAFVGGASVSTPSSAGIMSHMHSATLAGVSGQLYCNPLLVNNIIWHNRSFAYDRNAAALVPSPSTPTYRDLAVEGGFALSPQDCLFSNGAGAPPTPPGPGNFRANPAFVLQRLNTNQVAVVIDEAGNNLSLRFTPISLYRANGALQCDYHINSGSPARTQGQTVSGFPELAADFDANLRNLLTPDIGADQYSAATENIIPPTAPDILVAIVGPLPTGAPPAVNAPGIGAGVPPGAMLPPLSLNPLPGDPLNPLADPEPTIDSDGDGNPGNDVAFYALTAGDGLAMMADGQELYTFGFSDVTALVTNATAMAAAETDPVAREILLRAITPAIMQQGTLAANISAPTMVVKEGQHFHLDLSNVGMMLRPDLFDPHTVHFHGFPQAASIFDGEPMASISINMGATLRYYYNIVEPGTYIYHCHVEATEHMEMGMLGSLYVLPKQNNTGYPDGAGGMTGAGQKYAYNDGDGSTRYDVEVPLQTGAFDRNFHEQHIAVQPLPFAALDESYPLINGRGYPDTINDDPAGIANSLGIASLKVSSLVRAKVGQKVLLRLSNVSISDFHTLTVLGIPMTVVGKDARLLRGPTGRNLTYRTTSVTLGGGETADVILDTTGLAAGTYCVYDTRLNHLSNDQEDFGGMMTEIIIEP